MASVMATPSQRRPFAEIGTTRLGQLSAMKNTQNAITESIFQEAGKLGEKQAIKPQFTFSSPAKRPIQASSGFDDDDSVFDSENIDPMATSSKRSKGLDGNPSKKSIYQLEVTPVTKPIPETSNMPLSRTAPAGRSPKHKRVGILSRRRTPGPSFRAIHPPSFGPRKSTSNSLGFSIDAALNGTLASRSTNTEPQAAPASAQPKGWFFAIHEDTAEEEAGILMEHSCLTLDISSDDEAGPSNRDRLDKGKENIPPEDHQASQGDAQTSGSSVPTKQRRSVGPDVMSDEDRSPLGSLAAEDFYSEGLDATSVVVVTESDDKVEQSESVSTGQDALPLEAATVVERSAPTEPAPQAEEPPMIIIAEDASSSDPIS